jgi:hypothetical protein
MNIVVIIKVNIMLTIGCVLPVMLTIEPRMYNISIAFGSIFIVHVYVFFMSVLGIAYDCMPLKYKSPIEINNRIRQVHLN